MRRFAGLTIVAASLIGWMLTLNEGTTVRNWLARSVLPWLMKSSVRITSTGTGDSVTERGWARVPTTTTRSSSPTAISTSTVAVAPAITATVCGGASNPGRVNVTS